MDVTVPVNSTATVVVPATAAYQVTENGTPVTEVPGIAVVTQGEQGVVLAVGSGTYNFEADPYRQPSGPSAGGTITWTDGAIASGVGVGTETGQEPSSGAKATRRRAPRGLQLNVARADEELDPPYEFTISGRLLIPAGLRAATACRGKVGVVVKTGRSVLLSQLISVTKRCTFKRGVLIAGRRWAGRRGEFVISVRFAGNDELTPGRATRTRKVRYG